MVPLKLEHLPFDPAPRPAPIAEPMRPLLNHLRVTALSCRTAARSDLFQACAVLSTDRTVARSAFAETLVRGLAQALGQRPVLYRPGAREVSFDEAWLARLAHSAQSGDEDSFQFLIRARVPHAARRNLAFLVRAVAAEFQPV
ncbi:hypothetical protein [Roseivivax sp.]